MYPMITSVQEVAQIKKIVEEVKQELTSTGRPVWQSGAGYYDRDSGSSHH